MGPVTRLRAAWSFSRPHTIIGTTLSVVALYLLAHAHVGGHDPAALLRTLLAALGVNIFIVGLNQLSDIPIDRINKPYLPLASGVFTTAVGRALTWGSLALALVLAVAEGRWLLTAIAIGALVGTAYSARPLRLKRWPAAAASAIVVVRGLVVNLLLYAHFATRLGGSPEPPPQVLALTVMVLGLSTVIAWFKDIPDTEGDRRHAIRTLALRLGPRRTVALGLALLWTCYVALAVAALAGLPGVHGPVLAIAHGVLLVISLLVLRRLDLDSPGSVTRFYLSIWVLFFAEYLVFPAAGLLA